MEERGDGGEGEGAKEAMVTRRRPGLPAGKERSETAEGFLASGLNWGWVEPKLQDITRVLGRQHPL